MVRISEDTQAQLRELAAVFHSADDLEAAINSLASEGVDRADMSILGEEHLFSRDDSPPVGDTRDQADDPNAPRHSIISDTDIRQGRTLASSLAGVVAAFVATGATILTGGGALAAVVGAAVAGGGASAVVHAVGRSAGNKHQDFIAEQIRHGGIVLLLAVREAGNEGDIRQILQRHGGTDIHAVDEAS